MGQVTVSPQEWRYVQFDGERIAAVAGDILDRIDLDRDLHIEVDETTPLGRCRLGSIEPLTVQAQSGAFEDAKRPRQLSERAVADVLARLLLRAKDRLDPRFGDPPPDDELTLAQSTAWDAYAVGRASRLGLPSQKQRRLYHFRNRHGFSDLADETFERLWSGEDLTWADIEAACQATEPTRTPVG